MKTFKFLKVLAKDTAGGTAIEYGLILALIFLAMLGAIENIGTQINSTWDFVSSRVSESSAQARG